MRKSAVLTSISLGARLDRLPMNPLHRRVLAVVLIVYAFEFADQSAVGVAASAIRTHLDVTIEGLALAISATFLGVAIGATGGGWLSDRIGRKRLMVVGLVGMCVFSGLTVFAFDLASLVFLRVITGLAMGAAYLAATVYLAEIIPARRRGFALALCAIMGSLGAMAIAYIARFTIPLGDLGWRIVFAAGLVGLLVLPVALRLPESPRWLLKSGQHAEAERVLNRIEAASQAGRITDVGGVDADTDVEELTTSPTTPAPSLLRPPLLRGTAVVAICWIFYVALSQMFMTWSPTVLNLRGFDPAAALTIVALLPLGMIAGAVLTAVVINKVRAYSLLIGTAVIGAISALVFGLVALPVVLIAAGMIFGFVVGIFAPGLSTYMTEQFPTEVRGRGTGLAWSIGRVTSVGVPFAVAAALAAFGPSAVAWGTAGCWAAIALGVAIFGRRTAPGQSLEVLEPTRQVASPNEAATPAAEFR